MNHRLSAAPSVSPSVFGEDPRQAVHKSAQGAVATTLGGLFGRGAGLLTTLAVTHFVQTQEYGGANLALVIASIVQVASLFSPQQALLTRRDSFGEASQLVARPLLACGVVVFASLFLLSGLLLATLHAPSAVPLLRLYCVVLLCERLALFPALRLRYELRFFELSKVDLWADGAYVAATLGLAFLGAGVWCLPLGALGRQLVRLFGFRVVLGLGLWPSPVKVPSAPRLRAELWAMMWPIYLASLAELSTWYLDNVFVGRMYSLATQGLYAVGYTLVMTPCETLAMYASSALVRALGLADLTLRQHSFFLGVRVVLLLLVPFAVAAAGLAPVLEAVVFPVRWHGIAPFVAALGLGGACLGLHRLSFAQLSALHKSRLAAASFVVQVAVFFAGLALVLWTDPMHQHPVRVAWVVSLSLLCAAITGTAFCLHIQKLPFLRLLSACKPALGAAVVLASVLFAARFMSAYLGLRPSVAALFQTCLVVVAYVLFWLTALGDLVRSARRLFQ